MALEELDEHERSELVRSWLRQNGSAIIVGVIAGLGLILGYNQWQSMKRSHGEQAQSHYEDLAAAVDAKDAEKIASEYAALRKDYAGTPHAVYGALRVAHGEVERGELDEALVTLKWARDNASESALKDLTSLRLARVELAKNNAQAALDLATGVRTAGYKTLAAELRGDALAVLGRPAEAVTAYEDALAELEPFAPQRGYIEMKRDDLSTPAAPAAATAASDTKAGT